MKWPLPARRGRSAFSFVSGQPIGEPVAWYGPIVMNTQEELRIAFEEYQKGTFIKYGKPDRKVMTRNWVCPAVRVTMPVSSFGYEPRLKKIRLRKETPLRRAGT